MLLACSSLLLLLTLGMWAVMFEARRLVRLRDCDPGEGPAPSLSVVVAARDEERHLESALRTLLQVDYDRLELIVVDDRSRDATPEILRRLAAEDSRLRIERVDTLPPGWLGKNHALQRGLECAGGEYVLFTDADIHFRPDTLRRAVAFAENKRLDHLTALPEVEIHGVLARAAVLAFAVLFALRFKPWRAADPHSDAFLGIGAFNLVRREALLRVGGLAPIRMRPDDDLMLGKLLKRSGLRQEAVGGVGLIHVPWYANLRELVVGLEKNSFAGADYSLVRLTLMTLGVLVLLPVPFALLPIASGWSLALLATAGALQWLLGIGAAVELRLQWWLGLLLPLGGLLILYILWRAALLTLCRRGIRWRDTRYSLHELRANRVE